MVQFSMTLDDMIPNQDFKGTYAIIWHWICQKRYKRDKWLL